MEPMKKAWKFKLSEETKHSVKYRAGKALVWFLAFMLSATLLSRGADSLTVATISTKTPQRSAITQTIETDGLLELSGGSPVRVPSGVYVKEVLVENGQEVATGDLLFSYDIKEARKQIQGLELDIKKIAAEAADEKEKAKTEKEKAKTEKEKEAAKNEQSIERKEEDIAALEEDFEVRARELQRKLLAAKTALSKYDGIYRERYDDEEFTQAEHDSLRADYRALLFQQEQLEAERAKALQEVQRSIEDLAAEDFSDKDDPKSNSQLKALEEQKLRLELSTLYQAVESGGMVYAPSDGIVTDLKVETGATSAGESALFLTQKSGLIGKATLTKEQKKYIQVGESLTFTPYGERQGHKGLLVKKLEPSTENPGQYIMTVDVDGLDLPAGTGGTLSYNKKSVTYNTCVPLSALYSEGEQVYVLVTEDTETTLGAEKKARRVDVVVQEKNEKLAAVNGAITPESQVIVSSDKALTDGSRIRLEAVK